jgi:hypothetical protein
MTFKELLAAKHPRAWVDFECALISEEQLLATFFADGRSVDGPALKGMLVSVLDQRRCTGLGAGVGGRSRELCAA